jgi:hypothetical protein
VLEVEASFEQGAVSIRFAGTEPPPREELAAAVERAGYRVPGSVTGQWVTDLPIDEAGATAKLVLDLGRLGDRWVGEFDLAGFVEDYPVEMTLDGETVRLHLTAIGMDFEGTVSGDGGTLSGTGRVQETSEPLTFTRAADVPSLSDGFLEIEQAVADSSLVTVLSPDGAELRERFNRDVDRTRLLLLLSPT